MAPPKKTSTTKTAVYEGPPVTALPQGLTWPSGWTEQHYPRKSGTQADRVDKYWLPPTQGSTEPTPVTKLRSLQQVMRVLHPDKVPPPPPPKAQEPPAASTRAVTGPRSAKVAAVQNMAQPKQSLAAVPPQKKKKVVKKVVVKTKSGRTSRKVTKQKAVPVQKKATQAKRAPPKKRGAAPTQKKAPAATKKKSTTTAVASYQGPPITALPDNLVYPEGWIEKHVPRAGDGSSKHVDKYWIVPGDDNVAAPTAEEVTTTPHEPTPAVTPNGDTTKEGEEETKEKTTMDETKPAETPAADGATGDDDTPPPAAQPEEPATTPQTKPPPRSPKPKTYTLRSIPQVVRFLAVWTDTHNAQEAFTASKTSSSGGGGTTKTKKAPGRKRKAAAAKKDPKGPPQKRGRPPQKNAATTTKSVEEMAVEALVAEDQAQAAQVVVAVGEPIVDEMPVEGLEEATALGPPPAAEPESAASPQVVA